MPVARLGWVYGSRSFAKTPGGGRDGPGDLLPSAMLGDLPKTSRKEGTYANIEIDAISIAIPMFSESCDWATSEEPVQLDCLGRRARNDSITRSARPSEDLAQHLPASASGFGQSLTPMTPPSSEATPSYSTHMTAPPLSTELLNCPLDVPSQQLPQELQDQMSQAPSQPWPSEGGAFIPTPAASPNKPLKKSKPKPSPFASCLCLLRRPASLVSEWPLCQEVIQDANPRQVEFLHLARHPKTRPDKAFEI